MGKINNRYWIAFLGYLLIAVIGALVPSIYNDIIDFKRSSEVKFEYEVYEDYGLKNLRKNNSFSNQTGFQLLNSYKKRIQNEFEKLNYTISAVMNKAEVQIPISIADSMFISNHEKTKRITDKYYCLELIVTNGTKECIEINQISLAVEQAYKDPVLFMYHSGPEETEYTTAFPYNSSTPGYIIKPNEKKIINAKNLIKFYLFFDNRKIDVNEKLSFISYNGGEICNLQEKEKPFDEYNTLFNLLSRYFSIMIGLFLCAAGLHSIWVKLKAIKAVSGSKKKDEEKTS